MAKKSFDGSYMNRLMCGVTMILPITNRYSNINFSAGEKENDEKKLPYTHDTVLKNSLSNRMRIGFDKFTNALTLYPTKGLKGS